MKHALTLLLILAAPSLSCAGPLEDLRGLGAGARATWPELARLVDDAERFAADGRRQTYGRIHRERYGLMGASRAEARRDERALIEVLEALWVIERAAAMSGADSAPYRAAHLQLVAQINQGFEARYEDESKRANTRLPVLSSRHESGVGYAELFELLPRSSARLYGVVRPAVVLVQTLASNGRKVGRAVGALDDEHFPLTLALGAGGTTYVVAGEGRRSGPYTGSAYLRFQEGRLVLGYRRPGLPRLHLRLTRVDEGWRYGVKVPASVGAAGRLSARTSARLLLSGCLRPAADGALEGRWRLRDSAGVLVDEGREMLRLASAPAQASELAFMSPLFAKIVAAAQGKANKGTVPRDLLLSSGAPDRRAYLTGPEIFGEHANMIVAAEREVLLQTFVWETDSQASGLVLDALKELARRRAADGGPPVRVRIVVNGHFLKDGGYQALQASFASLDLDPRGVELRLMEHRHKLFGALHTKALVVDGRAAMVTGANLERCHDAGQPWFDAGFRVDGRVAEGIRADFVQLWHQVAGEWIPPLEGRPVEGAVPMLIATRRANGNPFSNDADDPQGRAYVAAIRNAKKLIRIQTPNLNDDAIKAALVHALVENGVRVELVLSRGFNERNEELLGQGGGNERNVRLLRQALSSSGDLAALGRLHVRWYSKSGAAVRGNGPGASHAKYASFDGQVAIVGSANMDTQTMNHSREVNIVVDCPRATAAWDAQLFERNFQRGVR